ncbi:hypothetical protein TNCT_404271 [Trichonephila clavata]|uniref:Uncharacterized protein n=1 Tax=Trichonephila clavata TaxID=2740835 RepID=A0A8X6HBY4_TRICU|nr:hypothetical protein TNCT_404271 [Trichonephila clavata]
MHPSTQQNGGFVHEYLRTLTSNTGFHTTSGLETSRGILIAGNDTEKSIVFPSPRHRGFVFQQSSTRHVSLRLQACFKPVNGPPKTFQDMDPLRNKETARTLIRKVLY